MLDFMNIVTSPLALSDVVLFFTKSFVVFEVSGGVVFEICFLKAYNLGNVILYDEFQLFLFLEEAVEVPE